jgi:hypothetical protein
MENSSQWVVPNVSGNGGVYKSLIDRVNKHDALRLAHVLAAAALFFPSQDAYPA